MPTIVLRSGYIRMNKVWILSVKWQDYYFGVLVCLVSCNKSKAMDKVLEVEKLPLFGASREDLSE